MNRKIAIVRSSYSPYGGAETLTLAIIRELLNLGLKVSLLTFPRQQWPLIHPNLTKVALGYHRGNRLWKLWFFERSVRTYLETHPFECVFSLDLVSTFTHLHAGGGSHRTFLRMRNEISSPFERLFRRASPFHAYTVFLQEKGFANPMLKKIHCCSNMVADDLHKDYQVPLDRMQIIYNGIDWEGIGSFFRRRGELAEELCRKNGLSLANNWLLFLGSGFSRKGLDIAITGLTSLPESYHLLVVGSDNPRTFANQASLLGINHRVHFIGPQEEGWKFSSICKALVLPSRYDPFGLAAAEAQAMGLPVLVSERTGYVELVTPGQNGVILDNFSTERIHHTFRELLRLIESPRMSPLEIRDSIRKLDNSVILKKLVCEFLGLDSS